MVYLYVEMIINYSFYTGHSSPSSFISSQNHASTSPGDVVTLPSGDCDEYSCCYDLEISAVDGVEPEMVTYHNPDYKVNGMRPSGSIVVLECPHDAMVTMDPEDHLAASKWDFSTIEAVCDVNIWKADHIAVTHLGCKGELYGRHSIHVDSLRSSISSVVCQRVQLLP